jgi:DNA-binding response OmpR family regulator
MNHKVLLADDSLTIQKVIKITLANQPYDIVDCNNDNELFQQLTKVRPKLVFLDFNLSEKYTGYELTSKIKSLVPSAQVLLLLGTFDNIDDAAMEKCGAADKVVKPFDSNKFIAICKRLADVDDVEEINFPEPAAENAEITNSEDQWTINHTVEKEDRPLKLETPEIKPSTFNALDQEINEWGMSVPGVINDNSPHDKLIDLPPVMELHTSKQEDQLESKFPLNEDLNFPVIEEAKKDNLSEIENFPQQADLEYPTIEELSGINNLKEEAKPEPKSKLISLDSLNDPGDYQIEHSINSAEETDISSIEAQIRDEVEADLWKIDEYQDLKQEVTAKLEEAQHTYGESEEKFDESLFRALDENESIDWTPDNTITTDSTAGTAAAESSNNLKLTPEINEVIEKMVEKHVKEYLDQMFKGNVEKVSWEVIPDLAENIIRQEISKISHRILNESN